MVVLDLGSNNLCFPGPLSPHPSHPLGTIHTHQAPRHTLPRKWEGASLMCLVSESSLPGRTVPFWKAMDAVRVGAKAAEAGTENATCVLDPSWTGHLPHNPHHLGLDDMAMSIT